MNRRHFLSSAGAMLLGGPMVLASSLSIPKASLKILTPKGEGLIYFSLLNSNEVMGKLIDGKRSGFAWVEPEDAIWVTGANSWDLCRMWGKVLFKQCPNTRAERLENDLEPTEESIVEASELTPSTRLNSKSLLLFRWWHRSMGGDRTMWTANNLTNLEDMRGGRDEHGWTFNGRSGW